MPQGMRAKMPPLDINAGFFYAPAHNGINSAAIRIAGIWRTAFYKYMLWVRAVRPRIFYIISQGGILLHPAGEASADLLS